MERVLQIRLSGENYNKLRQELTNSIILETNEYVGLANILAEIPRDTQWGAGFIALDKFLLRAPPSYTREVVTNGRLHLCGCQFNVTSNVSEVSLHSESHNVWVRLIELPYEMRGEETIAELVKTFGTFIEVDHNTKYNIDLRWARVYMYVASYSNIPPYIPLDVINDDDEKFQLHINVEQETLLSEPVIDLSTAIDENFNLLPILRTNSDSGVPDVPPGFMYHFRGCPTGPLQALRAAHSTPNVIATSASPSGRNVNESIKMPGK